MARMSSPVRAKGGIVWHTQGSGKSISMACFAAKLMQQPEMKNPTIVVVTDRNDLDGQLYQTFVNTRSLLRRRRSKQKTATNCARCSTAGSGRNHLQHDTEVRAGEGRRALSTALAPHQYRRRCRRGAPHTIRVSSCLDKKTGKYKYGFAKHLRDALPNATFIGFTGTPMESEDKDTRPSSAITSVSTTSRMQSRTTRPFRSITKADWRNWISTA